MKRLLLLIISVFFLGVMLAYTQDKPYALGLVKTMSSEKFYGRGFVKKGDKISAQFIEIELKKWGVKPFGESYQQSFPIDINTITKAQFETKTHRYKLGIDYLVYAGSSSSHGETQLYIPKDFKLGTFLKTNHQDKWFLLDTIHYKSAELIENYRKIINTKAVNNCAGIIEVIPNKLLQTQRTYQIGFPYLQVKSDAWDTLAQNVKIRVQNKFIENYQTQNVIGYIQGEMDSFYVFTAHYDHLGLVGNQIYFPGANDNASGVASVIDLAKYYYLLGKKPKYSIAFMLFSAEEAGLLGSEFYSKNPLFDLKKIKFLFNLDMVGTGVEGLSVVNGLSHPKASELIQDINREDSLFTDIRIGKGSANSDHHYFDQAGVPAIFIYLRGGPQFYHDIYDRSETLELNKHDQLIRLLTQFIEKYE